MRIRTGCCGLAGLSLTKYHTLFDVVELQSTFYRLPSPETAQLWRLRAPEQFEFSVKAFQGLTHPITSPTWRRAGRQRPTSMLEKYGHLQPTQENFDCWRRTMETCKILRAKICVVQLPPSFTCTDANVKNAEDFFGSIQRPVLVALEVRHPSWEEDPSVLRRVLDRIGGVHVVDPLVRGPVLTRKLCYYRLHGLGKRMYNYSYSFEDLQKLKREVEKQGCEVGYVMFNNINMREDCLKFKRLLRNEPITE